MELSEDQHNALATVLRWYLRHSGEKRFFRMGGYAGTGKTTVIDALVRSLGRRETSRVAVCAYTGKAAYRLRQKGVEDASTIHSRIYQTLLCCKHCGNEVDKGEDADEELYCRRFPGCERAGTEVDFGLVQILGVDLIIVDEASMVASDIHRDLLSFEVPVLYVGDHGQLEPIGDNPRLMLDPDVRLEQIHRQAADSPILRFAHHVRQHGTPETFGDAARVLHVNTVPPDAHEYEVVLCGRNRTRVAVNELIRRRRGYTGVLPNPGERLVCLRNSRKHGVFNGMLLTVVSVRADDRVDVPEITLVDDEGHAYTVPFEPAQLGNPERMDGVSRKKVLLDYGYALTCHKAQGSEFDSVLVLEWIHQDTSAARWRYTAATRARERLTWCMRAPRRTR